MATSTLWLGKLLMLSMPVSQGEPGENNAYSTQD